MQVPYEYTAQLNQGELAARNDDFRTAAIWFQHASELSTSQQDYLMALERAHFMHRLNGSNSASHSEMIERALIETKSVDLNEIVVLARAQAQNGIWLAKLFDQAPQLSWRDELIDQAITWLLAADTVLVSHKLTDEAAEVAKVRHDFGVAIRRA